MNEHVFALVDANHFYVSCERLFAASLRDRPTVVLSNNDGCIVALSPEAARYGLYKGMPLFACREIVAKYDISVFSSNYPLYQDISERMMAVLATFSPHTERYSIDEAWLDLGHVPKEHLSAYAQTIRGRVLQWIGIPVSVAVASSRVLCKVACATVKRHPEYAGVLNLFSLGGEQLDDLLAGFAAQDVWGIGKHSAERLSRYGILSAKALRDADHVLIRHRLNVLAQRAVLELRGICCLPLVERPKPKQELLVALSFSRPIEQIRELKEAIATYTVRVAEKLRAQRSVTAHLSIFIQTNPFEKQSPQYAGGASVTLPFATAFTPDLLEVALALLPTIYRSSYRYKRAGVALSQLRSQEVIQPDLFGVYSIEVEAQQRRLMEAVDHLNGQFGRDTIRYGAQGSTQDWFMQQRRRSPRYTTRWNEILPLSSGQPAQTGHTQRSTHHDQRSVATHDHRPLDRPTTPAGTGGEPRADTSNDAGSRGAHPLGSHADERERAGMVVSSHPCPQTGSTL